MDKDTIKFMMLSLETQRLMLELIQSKTNRVINHEKALDSEIANLKNYVRAYEERQYEQIQISW